MVVNTHKTRRETYTYALHTHWAELKSERNRHLSSTARAPAFTNCSFGDSHRNRRAPVRYDRFYRRCFVIGRNIKKKKISILFGACSAAGQRCPSKLKSTRCKRLLLKICWCGVKVKITVRLIYFYFSS